MMDTILTYIKIVFGFFCGMITYFFGGLDTVFLVLLSLICIDYITGVLAGIKTKTLSSTVGFEGILKKCGILCIVALSHFVGDYSGVPDVRSIVIGFYIVNESISILENASRLGVFIPEKLKDILIQLKDKQ